MKTAKTIPIPKPPAGLSKKSAEFWKSMNQKFEFESHDIVRLEMACRTMSLIEECQRAIAKDGAFKDGRGHAALPTLRDAKVTLLRCLREMAIDITLPDESRIPRQGRRYA